MFGISSAPVDGTGCFGYRHCEEIGIENEEYEDDTGEIHWYTSSHLVGYAIPELVREGRSGWCPGAQGRPW